MSDHVLLLVSTLLMFLEIGLLVAICWQGELIRRYEKWTYEIHSERHTERARWREQKRQQQIKRIEPKTDDSEKSLGSVSKTTTVVAPISATDALFAVDLSTPTDLPIPTTSTSK